VGVQHVLWEAIRWLVGVVETGNLRLNGSGETSERYQELVTLRSFNRKDSDEGLRIGSLQLMTHKQVIRKLPRRRKRENCQDAGKENTEKALN